MAGYKNWWVLGLLTGLSVWLRPDGITLAGPVLLSILTNESSWRAPVFIYDRIHGRRAGPYIALPGVQPGTGRHMVAEHFFCETGGIRDLPAAAAMATLPATSGGFAGWRGGLAVARIYHRYATRVAAQKLGDAGGYPLAIGLSGDLCNPAAGNLPARAVCHAGHAGLFYLVAGRDGGLG